MNLKIVVSKEPDITEPILSTIGCGIIRVKFPETYTKENIASFLNDHVENNRYEISNTLKNCIDNYYKKWTPKMSAILEEYHIGEFLPHFYDEIKIRHTPKIINVTSDNRGLNFNLRVTFDPICSLLPEETVDIILKLKILSACYDLYSIASSGFKTALINNNNVTVQHFGEDLYCKQKCDLLYQDLMIYVEKAKSKEVLDEIKVLDSYIVHSITI